MPNSFPLITEEDKKLTTMNPYEACPDKIPVTDRYADVPFFGRYYPRPDDFRPDPKYWQALSADALAYWTSVLALCDESSRIYTNEDGGRDVFALGSVIVKSRHLHSKPTDRDYSYTDANEVKAIALAKKNLQVKVPEIYFSGKINGHSVLVQERIPGVGLNIAWQYISVAQKKSFKQQARHLLGQMRNIQPPPEQSERSYVVPDPNPVQNKGIQDLENDILFSSTNRCPDLCFMHNDFSQSNCIVNDDKIVALVDWEMAGFFGWKTAGDVHVQIRSPRRQNYASLNLPEELLQDILFWNDLYQ